MAPFIIVVGIVVSARSIGFLYSIRLARSKVVAISAAAVLGSIVGSLGLLGARFAIPLLAVMTAAGMILVCFRAYRPRQKIASLSPVWRSTIYDLRGHKIACAVSVGVSGVVVALAIGSEPTVTGLLAAVIASVLSYVLAEHLFNIVYRFNLLIWPLGIVVGVLGMVVVGLMGMRPVLEQTPVEVLRRT